MVARSILLYWIFFLTLGTSTWAQQKENKLSAEYILYYKMDSTLRAYAEAGDSVKFLNAYTTYKQEGIEKNDERKLAWVDYRLFDFYLFRRMRPTNEMLKNLEVLAESSKQKQYDMIAGLCYMSMNYWYTQQKNFKQSLIYTFKAKELFDRVPDDQFRGKTYIYYELALSYYRFRDFEKCILLAQIASQYKSLNRFHMFNYNLLGMAYMQMKQFDSAHIHMNKTLTYALRLKKDRNITTWEGIALGNIGRIYYAEGNYSAAIPKLKAGLAICEENNLWDNASGFSIRLIDIYVQQKSPLASTLIDSARLYTYRDGSEQDFYDLYRVLSAYYKQAGDFEKSLYYADSAALFDKKLNDFFDTRFQARIESEAYQRNELKNLLQIEAEKNRSNIIRIAAVIIIFLILVIAFLLYNRQKLSLEKLNAQQKTLSLEKAKSESEKALIAQSLQNKENLVREIHHRVKNNLQIISSLLDIQSNSISDEKSKLALTESRNRIMSISIMHQQLYQHENMTTIEFRKFTQDLSFQINSLHKLLGRQVEIDIQIPETSLHIDTAVPLGLIMNELLTNSFKYAFVDDRLQIKISLEKIAPVEFVLHYKDSGPGLPSDHKPNKARSLGLILIFKLSRQLDGETTYAYDQGATFQIRFKEKFPAGNTRLS
ncbi:MAG: histidine kinase dimerization/phosphoacceptor domain -containing protein [Bacteroidia bacterium]